MATQWPRNYETYQQPTDYLPQLEGDPIGTLIIHNSKCPLEPARDFNRLRLKLSEAYKMKHVLTGILSTATIYGLLAATPVAAQVAGNPGDMHTPTPYTKQYDRQHGIAYGPNGPIYRTNGSSSTGAFGYGPNYAYGPFAPVGAVLGGAAAVGAGVVGAAGAVGAGAVDTAVGAPAAFGAPAYAAAPHAGCGMYRDFNGRYTAVCGP
jgi:hypothetical protein